MVKALVDWSLLLTRYHLLSLRLFHSFSIIFRTCESTSGSFSLLHQSGALVSKGF